MKRATIHYIKDGKIHHKKQGSFYPTGYSIKDQTETKYDLFYQGKPDLMYNGIPIGIPVIGVIVSGQFWKLGEINPYTVGFSKFLETMKEQFGKRDIKDYAKKQMEKTMQNQRPKKIITSSGVVYEPDKTRVGIISLNSCADWIFEEIHNGINITYESAIKEIEETGYFGGEKITDIEDFNDRWESSENDTILFGSWTKDKNGKYIPDLGGDFSATYHENTICVEWSKTTKRCGVTSPCYVMVDGRGPCGDLDSKGDIVQAFTLPDEYLRNID